MPTFGTVCDGIGCGHLGFAQAGFACAWSFEIEPFPSAVLAYRFPDVTNHGDMLKCAGMVKAGEIEAPDVFIGGTPCQAFSVAGKRKGLEDARGNLSLTFCGIADAIDDVRGRDGKPPCAVLWENVPGVLSDTGNAFGCFLGELAGSGCELQPAGGGWGNAGCVFGPRRTVAWRVLDSQFFGVAQRRRRVFVVASAGDWCRPEEVLFEREGVRRDSPPSREAGEGVTHDAGSGAKVGHWDGGDCHPSLTQSHNTGGIGASNQELFSQRGSGLVPCLTGTPYADNDGQEKRLVTVMAHGQANAEICENQSPTLNCNHEVPIAFCASGDVAHSLRGEGFDASEDGTGRGTPLVAFSCKDYGNGAAENLSPTLRAMEGVKPNGGGQMAIAFERHFVRTSGGQPSVNLQPCLRADANTGDGAPCVATDMLVRRLTPRECGRLQGLPTVEECVTIYTTQSEKSEWSDSPKSNVFAGMKCHNVPDSVRVVEGNVSPPSVECAGNNLLPNQADQNKHVRASVHINLEEHSLVLQIADRCVLCVNIAEGSDTLVHHGLPEHFVQLCVGIVTLSNKTRRGGEGGVPPLTTPFTAQNFGNRNVLKYGHVVEVSAVTAEENISEVQNCLKCIMSNPAQHIQKKEQILQTLCSYVMRVISLCILRKTPRGVLCQLDICTSGGWTLIPWRGKPAADCPDGPRYKGIGNGQTVNVMRWLANRIKNGMET